MLSFETSACFAACSEFVFAAAEIHSQTTILLPETLCMHAANKHNISQLVNTPVWKPRNHLQGGTRAHARIFFDERRYSWPHRFSQPFSISR